MLGGERRESELTAISACLGFGDAAEEDFEGTGDLAEAEDFENDAGDFPDEEIKFGD